MQSIIMSVSVCVCLSVFACLSVRISPERHARSFTNFLCMLPMAMTRSCSGRVTKSQGEGAVLGFTSPLTMHCTASATKWRVGSHTAGEV